MRNTMSRIKETPNQSPALVLEYRLDCGRTVYVEEIRVSPSAFGYLSGTKEAIRADVIKGLPTRVREQFPGNYGVVIKPILEGRLPTYTFEAALTCDQTVSDPKADFSSVVICW